MQLNTYMDAHTHLLDYSQKDRQEIIANAKQNKLQKIVANTTSSHQYQNMLKLWQQNDGFIIPGFGVHPYFITKQLSYYQQTDKIQKQQIHKLWKNKLIKYLQKDQRFTVGEIGLDFRKDNLQINPKKLQTQMFLEQLNLAIKMKRPVTIHCVRAHGQMLKLFKNLNRQLNSDQLPHLIMHSYGGSKQITKSLLKLTKLNMYYSLSLKRSIQLCQVIPVDRVICQTDSPCQNNLQLLQQMNYLQNNRYYQKLSKQSDKHPQNYIRNQSNEPSNVIPNIIQISRVYSKNLGITENKIIQKILQNTLKAFKVIK